MQNEQYPWSTPFELEVGERDATRREPRASEELSEFAFAELGLDDGETSDESWLPRAEAETYDQLPKVKTWIDGVSADAKSNESLLLFVRFHPQPRMAVIRYLHQVKAKHAWANPILQDIAAAKDFNELLDDVAMLLRAINFQHSKQDAAFGARFELEKTLREDVAAALQKLATWRRVRAYQVRAVLETDPWRMGRIGRAFAEDILQMAFPKLRGRIRKSAVPPTIYEAIGWHFQVVGTQRLGSDARFKQIVEATRKKQGR